MRGAEGAAAFDATRRDAAVRSPTTTLVRVAVLSALLLTMHVIHITTRILRAFRSLKNLRSQWNFSAMPSARR